MVDKSIVRVRIDIEIHETHAERRTPMVAHVKEELKRRDEEAMREAVLASLAGSEYERWVEARQSMSPEERERHLDELRSLVALRQGPGGP